MSAPTITVSPTTRFTGNRPQSSSGVAHSITTWGYVSSATTLGLARGRVVAFRAGVTLDVRVRGDESRAAARRRRGVAPSARHAPKVHRRAGRAENRTGHTNECQRETSPVGHHRAVPRTRETSQCYRKRTLDDSDRRERRVSGGESRRGGNAAMNRQRLGIVSHSGAPTTFDGLKAS